MKNFIKILSTEARAEVESIVINRQLIAAVVTAKVRLENVESAKDFVSIGTLRKDINAAITLVNALNDALFPQADDEAEDKAEEEVEDETTAPAAAF